jgi:hypothetical protein
MNRNLLRCSFLDAELTDTQKKRIIQSTKRTLLDKGLPNDEMTVSSYLYFGSIRTETYINKNDRIWVLDDGAKEAREFAVSTDAANIMALSTPLVRHYVVHFKNIVIEK